MFRTERMESKDKSRACWIFLSHFVCVCGKLSTYTTNHPQGGQCHDMRKEQKNEMMSDSHGKNRSYVKINLSVLQHLLHKPEQKKKKLVRRCFFPLKLSFITISLVLNDTVRGCGGKHDVLGGCCSCAASIRAARRDPGERPAPTSWSLDPFPDSDTTLLCPLGKSLPLQSPVFFCNVAMNDG